MPKVITKRKQQQKAAEEKGLRLTAAETLQWALAGLPVSRRHYKGASIEPKLIDRIYSDPWEAVESMHILCSISARAGLTKFLAGWKLWIVAHNDLVMATAGEMVQFDRLAAQAGVAETDLDSACRKVLQWMDVVFSGAAPESGSVMLPQPGDRFEGISVG